MPERGDSTDGDGGATGKDSNTQNDFTSLSGTHFASLATGSASLNGAVESSTDFEESQSALFEGAGRTITYDGPLAAPLPRASGQSSGLSSGRLSLPPSRSASSSPRGAESLASGRERNFSRHNFRGEASHSRHHKDWGNYKDLGLSPSARTPSPRMADHRDGGIPAPSSYDDTASARSSYSLHEHISQHHSSHYSRNSPSSYSDSDSATTQAPYSDSTADMPWSHLASMLDADFLLSLALSTDLSLILTAFKHFPSRKLLPTLGRLPDLEHLSDTAEEDPLQSTPPVSISLLQLQCTSMKVAPPNQHRR